MGKKLWSTGFHTTWGKEPPPVEIVNPRKVGADGLSFVACLSPNDHRGFTYHRPGHGNVCNVCNWQWAWIIGGEQCPYHLDCFPPEKRKPLQKLLEKQGMLIEQ